MKLQPLWPGPKTAAELDQRLSTLNDEWNTLDETAKGLIWQKTMMQSAMAFTAATAENAGAGQTIPTRHKTLKVVPLLIGGAALSGALFFTNDRWIYGCSPGIIFFGIAVAAAFQAVVFVASFASHLSGPSAY